MVDGRPGITDCYGAQIYNNGRWVRWQHMGCVT
jgi:hypothetical protein